MTLTLTQPLSLNSRAAFGRSGSDLLRLVDQLFDWQGTGGAASVAESKDGVTTVHLDLPGYRREDVTVETEQDTITVTARNERRGEVTRTFWVADLDASKVTAKLEDGVLTLSACRLESALPKRVEVG